MKLIDWLNVDVLIDACAHAPCAACLRHCGGSWAEHRGSGRSIEGVGGASLVNMSAAAAQRDNNNGEAGLQGTYQATAF